jgi:hypothetical protein
MPMTNDEEETLTEKWLRIFKNNPVVATLIIISLVIAGISGLSNSVKELIGFICPPTYESQFNKTVKLVKSDDPQKKIEGISLLQELTKTYPLKRQELINFLQTYLIETFPQNKAIDKKYLPVLKHAILILTTLPRIDDNGHPFTIDIHQIRIEGLDEPLDLRGTNFEGISLWDSQFINVILTYSNFQNADLGGTQFKDCSLEYAKFKGAKITGSFMDKGNGHHRPTRFINTRLYGSTIEEADLKFCELIGIRDLQDFQVDKLKKCAIIRLEE